MLSKSASWLIDKSSSKPPRRFTLMVSVNKSWKLWSSTQTEA